LALRRRRRGRRKKKRKEGEGRGKGRGILIVKQRSANQKREEGGKKEKETNINKITRIATKYNDENGMDH
jgi:hypothetical protein